MLQIITIIYVTHVQKNFLNSSFNYAQLSSYWQNIKFSWYCPKFHIFTKIVIFQVYLQLFRPTASSIYILWQGHVRNTLFHFCQLWAVKAQGKFIHSAHAAANLNSGYAKVARVHYFCTIALRTCRTVLTRAWASRRVDLREHRVDSFSKQVIIFCW